MFDSLQSSPSHMYTERIIAHSCSAIGSGVIHIVTNPQSSCVKMLSKVEVQRMRALSSTSTANQFSLQLNYCTNTKKSPRGHRFTVNEMYILTYKYCIKDNQINLTNLSPDPNMVFINTYKDISPLYV